MQIRQLFKILKANLLDYEYFADIKIDNISIDVPITKEEFVQNCIVSIPEIRILRIMGIPIVVISKFKILNYTLL